MIVEDMPEQVRDMVLTGCSLIDLLDFLRSAESYALTPLNFMRILNEACDIPMLESREILAMLDPGMWPIVAADELELCWRNNVGDAHR